MANCKKCKKEIPDDALYCSYCGKKQQYAKRKTHRRAKRTGSITLDRRNPKRPYVVKAPRYSGAVNSRYIGAYATYADAQSALATYLDDIHHDFSADTMAQIYDRWSAEHFPTLGESGVDGYASAFKSFAKLHNHIFAELKTDDYQRCIDSIAAEYSRSKCEKMKQLVSQLCKYAMKNDLINKNYGEFIMLKKETKKERRIFTDDELKTMWAHADDPRVQVILFMTYTGFRIGETFAITKDNIHLEEGYIVGGLKTKAGRDRVVPIRAELVPFVRSWVQQSNTDLMLNGGAANYRRRKFYAALADMGIIAPAKTRYNPDGTTTITYDTDITPHCCRHTFASLSAAANMPPQILQKIIGHADYRTTADIYIHTDISQLTAGMDMIKI